VITRYECPLSVCQWAWDEPEPELPTLADIAANPLGPLTARFANSEAVLRAHAETHPIEDWVREVMRLREERDRLFADWMIL
jgi:hypothetical protein